MFSELVIKLPPCLGFLKYLVDVSPKLEAIEDLASVMSYALWFLHFGDIYIWHCENSQFNIKPS